MTFNVVTSTKMDDKILSIEFNNANKNNALSLKMLDELYSLLSQKKLIKKYQIIVFKGHNDSSFSSGADLDDIEMLKKKNNLDIYHSKLNRVLCKLKELKVIKVSIINNFCIGAGFIFAMYTNICIANESCIFSVPASKLNIKLPEKQLKFLLNKFPKNQFIKEIIFSGRKFSALEAYRSNLINLVYKNRDFKNNYLEYLLELIKREDKIRKYYFSKIYS